MASLLCAQCGGPLPEAAARSVVTCPFCKVVSKPAPEVVEHVVERIVVATPTDAPGGLRCPRCADGLRTARVGASTLAGCGHCGGIWLDTKTVDHLRVVRDTDVETEARRLVGVIMRRVDRSPLVSCPVCSTAMRRTEAPGTIHTIDTCAAHGTWFDGLELPQFIEAFAEARAGEITEDDARAAGLPGSGSSGGGFFTDLFNAASVLLSK